MVYDSLIGGERTAGRDLGVWDPSKAVSSRPKNGLFRQRRTFVMDFKPLPPRWRCNVRAVPLAASARCAASLCRLCALCREPCERRPR